MNFALEAKHLADYIERLEFFPKPSENKRQEPYDHIGALYTNIILQAGLNYRTVVQPRVLRVQTNYPKAKTVTGFLEEIASEGIENIIKWKHKEKIRRLVDLLEFSKSNSINTCDDLSNYLAIESNHDRFLEIKGLGYKTLDYTLKLLSFDTVAVDRHIYSFVETAGLSATDYKSTKKIVEFAADLLKISRASIDYSIWLYMSDKLDGREQLSLKF